MRERRQRRTTEQRLRARTPQQRSRVHLLAAALALLVSIAAAAASAAPRGVLRVGTSGDYPPFSRGGAGFDVEVARLLAADLGLDVVWVPFRWPELAASVESGAFDIAMSGVTWRPERAVVGWMSRSVAAGGPCVVGKAAPRRVAVNRGGILERFARERFADAEVVAVDDNLALPALLAGGEVESFVTDSFEVVHFTRREWPVQCAPAVDRKVYWIAPSRAAELGPAVDDWLARREPEIEALRRRFFEQAAPRDEVDHLVDLLARRLAYMPLVAAWKQEHGRAVVDAARQQRVVEQALVGAMDQGLELEAVRQLFELQMALAAAIQERAPAASTTLDLETDIRPALLRLGARIIEALARTAPLAPESLVDSRLEPLGTLLDAVEVERLRLALLAVRPRRPGPGARSDGSALKSLKQRAFPLQRAHGALVGGG